MGAVATGGDGAFATGIGGIAGRIAAGVSWFEGSACVAIATEVEDGGAAGVAGSASFGTVTNTGALFRGGAARGGRTGFPAIAVCAGITGVVAAEPPSIRNTCPGWITYGGAIWLRAASAR